MGLKPFLMNKYLRCFHQTLLKRSFSNEVISVKSKIQEPKPKINKAPFMKNVLVGVVDRSLISYHEVETTFEDEPQLDCSLQLESKAIIKQDKALNVISGLRRMGFPEQYGGIPCNSSTFLRELDMLDISPITAFLLEMQYSYIISNILKFGTDNQKKLYLKDLISDTISGAYALHEEGAGSDPPSLTSTATCVEDDTYILKGEKTWVTNASTAKFFIVFCQVKEADKYNISPTDSRELTAFLVERNVPGLIINKQKNILDKFDIGQLKFENVIMTSDNILGDVGLGYKIATAGLESDKLIFINSVLNLLRKLSRQVTKHISSIKRFPNPLRDCELIQYKLSKIITAIYAIESSIYFLAGLRDKYIIDTSFESVIVQKLVRTWGMEIINLCLDLVGKESIGDDSYYKSILDDALLLSQTFTCPAIHTFYISLKGLEHAGKAISDTVQKSRNPLNYPGFIIKRLLTSSRQSKDNPKLDKELFLEYHPSLRGNAEQLEYSICRLQYSVEALLIQHGAESVHRQIDMERISNMACDIFAMFAVLARSSRAYCTGIQYSDQEMMAANAWCKEAMKRVKATTVDLVEERLNFCDVSFLQLTPFILQNKGYFYVNPTEKNIH